MAKEETTLSPEAMAAMIETMQKQLAAMTQPEPEPEPVKEPAKKAPAKKNTARSVVVADDPVATVKARQKQLQKAIKGFASMSGIEVRHNGKAPKKSRGGKWTNNPAKMVNVPWTYVVIHCAGKKSYGQYNRDALIELVKGCGYGFIKSASQKEQKLVYGTTSDGYPAGRGKSSGVAKKVTADEE